MIYDFDDFVEAFIDGSLKNDCTASEYQEIVDAYNSAIDDNLTTYISNNYDELFIEHFDGYYDGLGNADYQKLFDDHFSGYYDNLSNTEYQKLFDDYFGGYYDGLSNADYQKLFDDHFNGYYDSLSNAEYQKLFDDHFNGYYDGLSNAEYQNRLLHLPQLNLISFKNNSRRYTI